MTVQTLVAAAACALTLASAAAVAVGTLRDRRRRRHTLPPLSQQTLERLRDTEGGWSATRTVPR